MERIEGPDIEEKEIASTPETLGTDASPQTRTPEVENVYQMLRPEKDVLKTYEPEQQKEIERKLRILSSLAYFIGKDFKIPVELNEPGAGWHWDFQHNIIRVDPKDLLEKPMDYLRFVISHEGGHRRVSRTDFIPKEEWSQPGFSHMMNAIEDPRTNNFVAENYPKFREQMDIAYQMQLDLEEKAKQEATEELGHQPRYIQAGWEYIKQWLKEGNGQFGELSEDLQDDVREVVADTLSSAQDSWLRYPSRQEADSSEQLISKYAETSYEINRDEIWPEFKKLVEKDKEDQKMEQKLQDMQKGESGEGDGPQIPQELKDQLTPKEEQELRDALQQAIDKSQEPQGQKTEQESQGEPTTGDSGSEQQEGKSRAINLDSLSEETKQKIREYIESLPEDEKQELTRRATEALADFEKKIEEEIRGKLTPEPTEDQEASETKAEQPIEQEGEKRELSDEERKAVDEYRQLLDEALEHDRNIYEEKRREVIDTINRLEDELREIFIARRANRWESGHRSGKHIDIERRIQEKAKDVPVMESHAWKRRELPQEKDYAISLLVDLSGSMRGDKIDETFKGAIVLSEVLNRLSIDNEILGFNDRIHVFKGFHDTMSEDIRERMGAMYDEVNSARGRYNDDGWAVSEASARLAQEAAEEKFLIALSDGVPEPSSRHSGPEYSLGTVVRKIEQETDQKLIGLGIGQGTGHVRNFYPNSLANVDVHEMADKISALLREVIEKSNQF